MDRVFGIWTVLDFWPAVFPDSRWSQLVGEAQDPRRQDRRGGVRGSSKAADAAVTGELATQEVGGRNAKGAAGQPRGAFLPGSTLATREDRREGAEAKDGARGRVVHVRTQRGLRDAGSGTHPSVEAVTRATLFASGFRRSTPQLAIRTDFHDRAQAPSGSPTFSMAPAGSGLRAAQGR